MGRLDIEWVSSSPVLVRPQVLRLPVAATARDAGDSAHALHAPDLRLLPARPGHAQGDTRIAEIRAFAHRCVDDGVFLAADPLQDTGTATTIRVRDGEPS